MKVSKWVDMGQEVEVQIGADDVRCALAEAFARVTEDRLGEELPDRRIVLRCFNDIAEFLSAITDEQIAALSALQRTTIAKFLARNAERFQMETYPK